MADVTGPKVDAYLEDVRVRMGQHPWNFTYEGKVGDFRFSQYQYY